MEIGLSCPTGSMVTVTGLITGHYILCCAEIDETLHATVSMMSVHDCLIEKSKSCNIIKCHFFVCFSFLFLYFYYYNFSLLNMESVSREIASTQ